MINTTVGDAREIWEIMRENNVPPRVFTGNFHNAACIDVIAHIFPEHDALLMPGIKSGTHTHIRTRVRTQ